VAVLAAPPDELALAQPHEVGLDAIFGHPREFFHEPGVVSAVACGLAFFGVGRVVIDFCVEDAAVQAVLLGQVTVVFKTVAGVEVEQVFVGNPYFSLTKRPFVPEQPGLFSLLEQTVDLPFADAQRGSELGAWVVLVGFRVGFSSVSQPADDVGYQGAQAHAMFLGEAPVKENAGA